jgi:hypothetical protein
MNAALPALLLASVLVAGCGSLLPSASADMTSPFASYEDAERAAARIEPFRTKVSQLPELGFDLRDGKNVTVIPYPDIVARLAPYSGVPFELLDPGVRACILAKTDCRAYVFRIHHEDRKRNGPFLTDFFNVHRRTAITGWWFEALVVVSRDEVLFRNIAGQARTERFERETNPLGPFQPAGASAGAVLLH